MRLVEQAIYTSIERDGKSGYQVVARSAGVCDADACELTVWEPSSDAMLDPTVEAESFNFHPLPSGAFCVSRSTSAGWEHDGGRRVHTHCLIVAPEVMAWYDNHPFALIHAMSAGDLWLNPSTPCQRLEPFCPPGKAAGVDEALLRQLALDPGPEPMAALVQQACNSVCLTIGGVDRPWAMIAGLFHCLPPECRLEFSFSTGLRFSPWRPFRIVTLSDDTAERLWVASYPNITVLEVGSSAIPDSIPLDGWAAMVERALATENIPFLAAQVSQRRPDLTLDDLSALGLQLLEDLDHSDFYSDQPFPKPSSALGQLAHAAHRKFEKSHPSSTATLRTFAGTKHSESYKPEVLEKLERLDDLVYEAISGQTMSLEKLRDVWPQLIDELGENTLAESREQYLRYALSIWTDCAEAGKVRDPARAIQALDILCLLFGESTSS